MNDRTCRSLDSAAAGRQPETGRRPPLATSSPDTLGDTRWHRSSTNLGSVRRNVTASPYRRTVLSNEAFAIASIQLYTGLWSELDLLVTSCQCDASPLPADTATVRLEILRLELIVIIDACDGGCWRSRLHSAQLQSLKATLEHALTALACAVGDDLTVSIERAQDHLLDAILDLCSVSSGMRTSRPLISAAS